MRSFKKSVALFLSALMLISLLPLAVLAEEISNEQENETVEPTYVITSAEELLAFAAEVNNGASFKNELVVLGADIDLDGYSWDPIGNGEELILGTDDEIPTVPYNYFAGTFDGQGYSISNVYCEGSPAGIFGIITGEIKNLTVKNSCFIGGFAVGAIAGYGQLGAVVKNCQGIANRIEGEITVGGIIGQMSNGFIANCVNQSDTGNVYGNESGGIVGKAICTQITDCANTGYVGAYEYAGGIVGICYDQESGNNSVIDNCCNLGLVNAYSQYAGGIAGAFRNGTISNCHNTGDVIAGDSYAGGIAGEMTFGSISDCVNIGEIISTNYKGGIIASYELYIWPDDSGKENLPLEEIIKDCYYSESSADIGIHMFVTVQYDGQYQSQEQPDDISNIIKVKTGDEVYKNRFENLDFNTYWVMGNNGAQLKFFKKLYREYIPEATPEETPVYGSVKVLGVELADGEYLANGAAVATTEEPDVGYAYFKNNKLYLNNFYYSGEGALYGVSKYAILTYDNVEIVLVGENIIDFKLGEYAQMPVAIAHARGKSDEFAVTYSGNGTLQINSEAKGIFCYGDLVFNGGVYNITAEQQPLFAKNITFNNGEFDITSLDEYTAIESFESIYVYGGDFEISSMYYGIGCANGFYVENGTFDIQSKNDGIHVDDVIEVDGGTFNIETYSNGIFAYYGVVINGGDFYINADFYGICADYYDVCIYGGYIEIYALYAVNSCEGVVIQDAKISIDSEYGLESCNGSDIIIKNSKVDINADFAIVSAKNTEIINSTVDIISTCEGIYSECETFIENSSIYIYSDEVAIYCNHGNICITDSDVEISALYGMEIVNEYDIYITDSSVEMYVSDKAMTALGIYFEGKNDVYISCAENIFYGEEVYFYDGEYYFEADSVFGNVYFYYLENEDLVETWDTTGDSGYAEVLEIKSNGQNVGTLPPEELPKEETSDESSGDVQDMAVVYVGGIELSDGEYLANGSNTTTQYKPNRGGYAYFKDGVLILNNYNYYGSGVDFYVNPHYSINSLLLSEVDLEIVLVGENVLSNTISLSDGITVIGALSVSGEGSLKLVSTEGIYSYGEGVSINANVVVDAERTGITADLINVEGGKLIVSGEKAFDTTQILLGENMKFTEGDETSDSITIEYVAPVIPDESSDVIEESSDIIEESSDVIEESSDVIEESSDITEDSSTDDTSSDDISDDTSSDDDSDDTSSDDTSSDDVIEEVAVGDINQNGKTDMTDYILLKRAYFGTYNFSDAQKAAGDINHNGKIDMLDYILLKRVYFGTYTLK